MAADFVLYIHVALVLFIVLAVPLIYVGATRHWTWVRWRRWRQVHLAAIVLIALESILGIACPLTVWEDAMRGHQLPSGFIERWVSRLLYYEFPSWVFAVAYTLYAAIVAYTWWRVRPAAPGRHAAGR